MEVAPLVVAPVEVVPVTVAPVAVAAAGPVPTAAAAAAVVTTTEAVTAEAVTAEAVTAVEVPAAAAVTAATARRAAADTPVVAAAADPAPPAPPAPAPGHLLDRLVALATVVGAGPEPARAAAEAVVASGVRTVRHALPLLAASLAEQQVGHHDHDHHDHDLTDLSDDLSDDLGADDTDLAPTVPARAGDVVVVLGAPGRVDAAAADVAAQLGTSFAARWSDDPPGRRTPGAPAGEVLRESRAVAGLAGRARAQDLPAVLAVADASLAEGVPATLVGRGRAALLRALGADVVVLVVEADTPRRRQAVVVGRVTEAHGPGRPLVLSVVGCDGASAPLAHADRPVALLDGRRAGVGTWTGVVLDALRAGAR